MRQPARSLFSDAIRRAKARLSDMQTQEVSLVDQAANLRRFAIVKSKDANMTDRSAVKKALSLPTEAKQGLMDGLGQALDKITALATVVGDATEDDAASVPADLGAALLQCAEVLEGLATQYAPAPAAPDAPPAADVMAAAAPEGAPAEAAKALPPPMRDGDNMTPMKDSLTLAPKTASAAGELLKALGEELVDTAKAGRKMAASRYKKLSELHNALGSLLNELSYDEASEAATARSAKDQTKKSLEAPLAVTSSSETDKKLDLLLQITKANAERITMHETTIAKMARATETPNAHQLEGSPAPTPTNVWPADMSAAIAKRKAAR